MKYEKWKYEIWNMKYKIWNMKWKYEVIFVRSSLCSMYGWAMMPAQPEGRCVWLTPDELRTLDVGAIPTNGPYGYIIECDMSYPSDLHKSHSMLPLAPVKRAVHWEELSPYALTLLDELGLPLSHQPKLLLTLEPKSKYAVHHDLLKLYVWLGMKITHVHRAVRFGQSNYLAGFVTFNAGLRAHASNDLETSQYKLVENSVFGKFMENVRNRQRVLLVTTADDMNNYTAKITFSRAKIFYHDLVAIYLTRCVTTLCKPIHIGVSILDTAKCTL
jgi:hypothetical protein